MIETERLILRNWQDSDRLPFHAMNNDPEVMMHLGPLQSIADTDDVLARLHRYTRDLGHTFWALERRENGKFLGFCGLKRSQNGPPTGMLEIGWRLTRDAWGKGYAKEAALASLAWAQQHYPGEQVIALTVIGNKNSWGLMKRLGMHRRTDLDFLLPDPGNRYDERLRDTIVYSTEPA